jgi:hypothetical protein
MLMINKRKLTTRYTREGKDKKAKIKNSSSRKRKKETNTASKASRKQKTPRKCRIVRRIWEKREKRGN